MPRRVQDIHDLKKQYVPKLAEKGWSKIYLKNAFYNLDDHLLTGWPVGQTLLEWYFTKGLLNMEESYIINNAAKGDQLHIIRWLRANDCPWNDLTCASAAEGGRLELLVVLGIQVHVHMQLEEVIWKSCNG